MLSQNAEKHSREQAPPGGKENHASRVDVEQACVRWEVDLKLFLLSVLRDSHLVEDAFQKMVLKAIEAAESAHTETLRGWLFRIALNEARLIQRERRRDELYREKLAEQISVEQPGRLEGLESKLVVEFGVLNEEMVHSIRLSMKRLPSEQQDVIRRRIYDGQTFAVIAEQMELPLGTVLTWMRRGLQRLREDSNLKALWDE